MGSGFWGGSSSMEFPKPPPAALSPTLSDPKAASAAAAARARAALAAGAGFGGTIKTSGAGIGPTPTTLAQPSLIGASSG